jgi:hypothetical protein
MTALQGGSPCVWVLSGSCTALQPQGSGGRPDSFHAAKRELCLAGGVQCAALSVDRRGRHGSFHRTSGCITRRTPRGTSSPGEETHSDHPQR